MRSAPRNAEFSSWREWIHAAALTGGGERSWISAAVNLSTTCMGPPHFGQRQEGGKSGVSEGSGHCPKKPKRLLPIFAGTALLSGPCWISSSQLVSSMSQPIRETRFGRSMNRSSTTAGIMCRSLIGRFLRILAEYMSDIPTNQAYHYASEPGVALTLFLDRRIHPPRLQDVLRRPEAQIVHVIGDVGPSVYHSCGDNNNVARLHDDFPYVISHSPT